MEKQASVRDTYMAYMRGEATWQQVIERAEDAAAAFYGRPRRLNPHAAPDAHPSA